MAPLTARRRRGGATSPPRPGWARRRTPSAPEPPHGALAAAGEAAGGLALLGLLLFVVCYSYERAFYGVFELTPDEVGQSYAVVLARAATGLSALAAVATPYAARAAFRSVVGAGRWDAFGWRRRAALQGSAAAVVGCVAGWLLGLPLWVALVAAAVASAGTSTATGVPVRRNARSTGELLYWLGRAAPLLVIVYVLLSAAALRAGTADARRLVGLSRAGPEASIWQALLGMPAPAATVVWVEPGSRRRSASARVLGAPGEFLVVFDLDSCTLRRLPAGAVATSVRLGGLAAGPQAPSRGSALPRCPR